MNERVKELRKKLKLTQAEFGKGIGLSGAAISHCEKGRKGLSGVAVRAICTVYKVNEVWLTTGTGPMFQPDKEPKSSAELLEQIKRSPSLKDLQKLLLAECLSLEDEEQAKVAEYIDLLLLQREKRRRLKEAEQD